MVKCTFPILNQARRCSSAPTEATDCRHLMIPPRPYLLIPDTFGDIRCLLIYGRIDEKA